MRDGTWKLSKMLGSTASSRLRYREAFRTGAVLLWRMSETRKRRETLVGGGVSARVRDSVRISTICCTGNDIVKRMLLLCEVCEPCCTLTPVKRQCAHTKHSVSPHMYHRRIR